MLRLIAPAVSSGVVTPFRLVLKAAQLGFTFGPRKPVEHPGSHGSTKWFYDEQGHVVYGARPAPHTPSTSLPTGPFAGFAVGDAISAHVGVLQDRDGNLTDFGWEPAQVTAIESGGTILRYKTRNGFGTAHGPDEIRRPTVVPPPVGTPTPPKLTVQDAEALGTAARDRAAMMVPAQDPHLLGRLAGLPVGEARPYLEAWIRGWHRRNLSTDAPPFPEPAVAPPPKVEATGQVTMPGVPLSTVGPAARPSEAKPITDTHAQPWELLQKDCETRALGREWTRLAGNIKAYGAELATLRPGTKKHRDIGFWLETWTKDLARLEAQDPTIIERVERNARLQYVKIVKLALSTGKPVPMAVIRQSVEFRKALDARVRYEKGRHTSFANISVAVDATMQSTHGYKVKRQDGTAIVPSQKQQIADGVADIQAVLGPLADIFSASDLTIAHTNGKHPFLRDSGGLYSSGERTVTVGIAHCPALAHELGHFLDFEAGRRLGQEVNSYHGGYGHARRVRSTSLAEIDANTYSGENPGRELIRKARAAINNVREVTLTLKKRLNATEDPTERQAIERAKVSLGPYWREPCEVWARLVEQFIATKLGRRGFGQDSPEYYGTAPGWWMPAVFAQLAPEVERELQRRLAILRAPRKAETAA